MSKESGEAPATPAADSSPTGQDVFAAVSGDDVATDAGGGSPASEPASPTSEPAPSAPSPGAAPTTPSEPPAAAAPTPATPATPASPEQPAAATSPAELTPAQPAPTLEQPGQPSGQYTPEQLKQFEVEAIGELTQQYQLTPEQLAQVEEKGVHAVIPELLARAHINFMNTALRLIQTQTPGMFRNMYMSENAKRVFADKFFKAFPALRDAKHAPTVRDLLKRARALDPGMSMDDLIEMVGSAASVKLKLPRTGGQAAVRPATPASPASTFAPSAPAPRPTPPAPAAPAPSAGPNWKEFVEED